MWITDREERRRLSRGDPRIQMETGSRESRDGTPLLAACFPVMTTDIVRTDSNRQSTQSVNTIVREYVFYVFLKIQKMRPF